MNPSALSSTSTGTTNTVDGHGARADLGGTLFSRHLALAGNYKGPERVLAKTGTECSGGIIEVVLALDVTASMNAAIDKSVPQDDNQRMPVAIEAAKTLVEELHSGCDDTDVVIGVVPWDKTVRLPSPATMVDHQRAGWTRATFTAARAPFPATRRGPDA